MRRIPVAPRMDDPPALEPGDRTAGNLRWRRGEIGAVVGSLLGRRCQPAHENIVAGSEGTFDREVMARDGVEVGLHGSSGVVGPTKQRWISVGLADVAVVEQRGVAVDIAEIPRVKGLVHDSQGGSLPGAQGLTAIEGRPEGRDDVVQLGDVLEVRLERRHDDAGFDRRQVDPGQRDTSPRVDDDALVEDPFEDLDDVGPLQALNNEYVPAVVITTTTVLP